MKSRTSRAADRQTLRARDTDRCLDSGEGLAEASSPGIHQGGVRYSSSIIWGGVPQQQFRAKRRNSTFYSESTRSPAEIFSRIFSRLGWASAEGRGAENIWPRAISTQEAFRPGNWLFLVLWAQDRLARGWGGWGQVGVLQTWKLRHRSWLAHLFPRAFLWIVQRFFGVWSRIAIGQAAVG